MSPLSLRARRCAAVGAFLPMVLAGCSSPAEPGPARAADAVTVADQWAKAAGSGMSAAFGELRNTGGVPVTVVSATSPVSSRMELHEVVPDGGAMVMREKAGGFVIPPGGALSLRPGGDHLMFMDLVAPLRTGSDAEVVLTFADGSTTTFRAQVRDFAGAQENYVPGHGA